MRKGLQEPAKRMGLTFAGGKFDFRSALPLSAFRDAMADLTEQVADTHQVAKLKHDIKGVLTSEDMARITRVLPGCDELFPSAVVGPSVAAIEIERRRSSIGGKEAVQRLQYAIRKLMKLICSYLKGVVLFLDDMQWADVATIELMKSIALDNNIPYLLLVGAYRDDEVPKCVLVSFCGKQKRAL